MKASTETPSITFVCGAGSTRLTDLGKSHYSWPNESTWAPLLEALGIFLGASAREFDPILALRELAKIKLIVDRGILDLLTPPHCLSNKIREVIDQWVQLKRRVSRNYSDATIRSFVEPRRCDFQWILDHIKSEMKVDNPGLYLINLNFDSAIESLFPDIPRGVERLHGPTASNDELILPFESSIANFGQLKLLEEVKQGLCEKDFKLCSEALGSREIHQSHGRLLGALEQSDLVVLWRLSCADYDYELSSLLSTAKVSETPVWIVNPSQSDAERCALWIGVSPKYRCDIDPNKKTFRNYME